MDFHGIVGVHDKNVAERPPEESLLIFASGVLMQGNEVVKDPHDGIQEPGTELLHDRIQLEPRSKGSRTRWCNINRTVIADLLLQHSPRIIPHESGTSTDPDAACSPTCG